VTVTITLFIEPTMCAVVYADIDSTIQIDLECCPTSLMGSELTSDPPLAYELTNAIGLITDELDDALREMPDIAFDARFAARGSLMVTAAAVEVGHREMTRWPSAVFSKDQLEDVFRTLVTEQRSDRAHNPGLPGDEADVIVGAMCIVVAFMRRLSVSQLTIS
jgi:exopolyphosphatase/pppGpp-phosphohydrolase